MALGVGLPMELDVNTQRLSGSVSDGETSSSYILHFTASTTTTAIDQEHSAFIHGEFIDGDNEPVFVERLFYGQDAIDMRKHLDTALPEELISMARTMAMDSEDKQLELGFESEDRANALETNTLEMLDLQQAQKNVKATAQLPQAKKPSSLGI